ncbi:MAG: SAM-dependent methyltransferase, partial [Pseudonocardia sp.]|nr:SAM-dependent methyltransferase [Pseudonocardia sp.]
MTLDQSALDDFLGRFVTDLGATAAAASVVIGHRLGLYRALAEGPASPAELADRTGTQVRPVTEWLRGQAAGGYVTYDAGTDHFELTEEQAFCLADPDGPL